MKDESFYENLTEADWAMKLTAGTISENTPSDTFVSKTPELEGPTTAEIRALIHVIEAGVKVVSECVSALISATNGVHSKVTISGSQNEEQKRW